MLKGPENTIQALVFSDDFSSINPNLRHSILDVMWLVRIFLTVVKFGLNGLYNMEKMGNLARPKDAIWMFHAFG